MRIAAVLNMITPYSTPVLAGLAETPGCDLLAAYETVEEPNRRWKMSLDLPFEHVVLESWTVNVSHLAVGSGMKVVTDHYLHIPRHPLRALARYRPDVVIAAGGGIWSSPTNLAVLAARRRYGWAVVPWWGSFRRTSPTLPRRLCEPWVRYFMRSCDAWIAYGTRAARDLYELGADSERVVIAPFAGPRRVESSGVAPAAIGDDPRPRYLFAGQLIERKGIRTLLRAFSDIDGGELWIVGDGPLREEVRSAALADSRIRWLGQLDARGLDELYAAADVFVLPSLYEVWGLVVNEALEHGLPVIATDQTGAVDDLLVPDVTGRIVEAGSHEQLRLAMLEVGNWPAEKRRRCAEEAARTLGRWSVDEAVVGFRHACELATEHVQQRA